MPFPSHADPYLRLTLSSGSGRVMNLHRVTQRLVSKGEGGKRFFGTSALNNAYLIKDVDPRIDPVMDRERIRVRTRIYLPFDPQNAFEGGQMIDVGSRAYRTSLEHFADVSVPERRQALETDIAMLGVMDELPSLAPFLVRDRLERAGYPIDDRYVQVSANEWDEISHFIRTQFRKIITAVFGASTSGGDDRKLDQLLQKLWDLEDKPALQALAAAFRLPTENPETTFYAWKGVIYFTYEYGTFADRIRRFLLWLKNDATVPSWTAAPIPREVSRLRDALFARMTADLDDVNLRLAMYQQSFDDLFGGNKGAQPFIEFLAKASQHFNVLGVAIGRVQHVTLVWDRFHTALKGKPPRPEVLVDLLGALAQVLGEPVKTKAVAQTVVAVR